MIKQIQLRGISRAPSDRLSEDGGVAESLNAQIIDGEIAPITEPLSCLDDFSVGGEFDTNEVVYIHKTSSYEHTIVHNHIGDQLLYVVNGEKKPVLEIQNLKKIASLGNTLIITHEKGVSYALFKDGQYYEIALDEDSLPKLSFVNVDVEAGWKQYGAYDVWHYDYFEAEYGIYVEGDKDKGYLITDEKQQELANNIWRTYRSLVDNNLKKGCLSQPVMLRYGLRLHDGSYLWASSPIMLGSYLPKTRGITGHDPIAALRDACSPVIAYSLYRPEAYTNHRVYVRLADPYRIGINVHRTEKIAALKDIVASIDVFISSPIDFYPNGKTHIKQEAFDFNDGYWLAGKKYIFDPENSENPKKVEEAVLSASNFYLLKRYDIAELPEEMDVFDGDLLGETLFVQQQLDDSKVVTTIADANVLATYNKRFIAGGIDEYFSRGIGVLNGQCANPNEFLVNEATQTFTYGFAYHIPNADVVVKDFDAKTGDASMTPDVGKAVKEDGTIVDVASTPYAWISHPNPNCTKVTVRLYTDGEPYYTYNIEMKPHPYLQCSYAFLGIGQNLYKEGVSVEDDFDSFNDKPITKRHNVAAMSNLENPFVFSSASKMTLNDNILGFAIATEPMSVGQFGQYPIYFFLEDGVWTTTIAADGNFGSSPALASREVCSNPNTITPSNNAVFFMTNRGLLYISGQATASISEYMQGKPYEIPENVTAIIEKAGFNGLIPEGSVERFVDFMNSPDTSIAYDYVGERLICFNQFMEYQYVYAIKTRTWHKTHYGTLNRVINAYPRCAVTTKKNQRSGSMIVTLYGLVDLSLSYDETLTAKKVIVITRPFDLGMPDVFKSITSIKIRGDYDKGNVKYFLQGSDNGKDFYTLNSLRGKSWKMFRIFILADLEPTERISWIDVDFEPRYNNRLR